MQTCEEEVKQNIFWKKLKKKNTAFFHKKTETFNKTEKCKLTFVNRLLLLQQKHFYWLANTAKTRPLTSTDQNKFLQIFIFEGNIIKFWWLELWAVNILEKNIVLYYSPNNTIPSFNYLSCQVLSGEINILKLKSARSVFCFWSCYFA